MTRWPGTVTVADRPREPGRGKGRCLVGLGGPSAPRLHARASATTKRSVSAVFSPPADGTSLGTEEGHAPPVPTRGRGGAGAEDTRGAAGTMTKRRPETSAGENLSSESIPEGRLNLKRRCAERLPEPSERAARSFGFLIESGG